MSWSNLKLFGLLAVAVSVLLGAWSSWKPHSEAALLVDWSDTPPWPIFVAVNALAGALRTAADALTPPPIKMLEMAMGYHHTILVHIAQKFKIPDLLANGPLSAADIAAAVGSDPQYIERIMYACSAIGVFKLEASPADKGHRFVNNALSAVLRVDHPNSMRAMVGHNAEEAYPMWGKLVDFVANPKGAVAWDLAFPDYPLANGGVWSYFEASPSQENQFARAMTSLDSLGAKAMVHDGPWARFTRVVDIGGGRGHFVHRLLEAHPSLHGVVVDRAPVIDLAKKAWADDGEFSSVASRAKLQAGDFFQASSIPKGADGDAYYMRYILHDWPLEEALTILRNVRAAMGSAAATLLIGECALPDHDKVGAPAVMYQIDIQMMAHFGNAQERTPAQWKHLLSSVGFEVVAFHSTRSLLHWVEARPV
jgi:hypothetical protein